MPPKKSSKAILLFTGMPSMPSKKEVLEFWAKKGYWVFYPRYRGTWESGGDFLKLSPEKDVLDVISAVQSGFEDFEDGRKYKLDLKSLYLFGSSFGGTAVLLNSKNPKVNKVIAFSPVIDWRVPSKAEPIDWLGKFVKKAYGHVYRFSNKNWAKLKKGNFYNPVTELEKIDGRKIMIIHAKDDRTVSYLPCWKFAEKTGAKLILLKKGGHMGSRNFINPKFQKEINKFLAVK